MDYDAVTSALAKHLGVDNPDLLRLTQQNNFLQQPMRLPLRHRCAHTLDRMLSHSNHPTDTLYYEVLDIPLPQLELLKTLKVGGGEGRPGLVWGDRALSKLAAAGIAAGERGWGWGRGYCEREGRLSGA